MVFKIVVIFAILYCSITFGQKSLYLYYGDEELHWSDYTQESIKESRASAITFSGTEYYYRFNKDTLEMKIRSYFDKEKSWVISKDTSEFLLAHEKYHFHITEYGTRLFVKFLKEHKFTSLDTAADDINSIYKKMRAIVLKTQKEYDEATKHSINKEMQEKWEKKIDGLLLSVEQFSIEQIKVKIPNN